MLRSRIVQTLNVQKRVSRMSESLRGFSVRQDPFQGRTAHTKCGMYLLGPSLAAALPAERRVLARRGWAGEKSELFEHPAKSFGRLGRGYQLKHGGRIAFGDFAAEFLALEKNDAETGASFISEVHVGLETSPATEFDGATGDLSRRVVERAIEGLEIGKNLIVGGLALVADRSEEHTSELQSPCNLVCRLLLE